MNKLAAVCFSMKNKILIVVVLVMTALAAQAVMIGLFPGLDKLIEKADAIVILRVDKHVTGFGSPTLYSTHDCYVYQTLKGEIPAGKTIRLQLMDTRDFSETPFAIHSTHLVFLTRKRSPNEPTDYRTIEFTGANIRLTPFGHEKKPDGKMIKEQITSVIKRTMEYRKKQHDKEQAFLSQMIGGTARQAKAGGLSRPDYIGNNLGMMTEQLLEDKAFIANAELALKFLQKTKSAAALRWELPYSYEVSKTHATLAYRTKAMGKHNYLVLKIDLKTRSVSPLPVL